MEHLSLEISRLIEGVVSLQAIFGEVNVTEKRWMYYVFNLGRKFPFPLLYLRLDNCVWLTLTALAVIADVVFKFHCISADDAFAVGKCPTLFLCDDAAAPVVACKADDDDVALPPPRIALPMPKPLPLNQCLLIFDVACLVRKRKPSMGRKPYIEQI
ncbi:hypothetical protein FF38_07093 [Lucilia cuprina]|uniref:Uncharacterized protein n=1 Tax=Lucilia cuprina TaxID=7375 RepID=A0A0L0C8B9_LUCCU|nr:hypothetical protein FF38_07093 [Lucilia cuprina]